MYHQQRQVDQLPEELNKMQMTAHSKSTHPKKHFLEKYKISDSMISCTAEAESDMPVSSTQPPVSMQSPQQPRSPTIDEMADDNTVDDVVSPVSSMAERCLVDHGNIVQYFDNDKQALAPVVPKTHAKTCACTCGIMLPNKYKLSVFIDKKMRSPLILEDTWASDRVPNNSLGQLNVYFYPESRQVASKFMADFISFVAVDKKTEKMSAVYCFDEEVTRVCSSCVSRTKIFRLSHPAIPEEVFERNTTKTEFLIHKVIAPPIKFKPQPEQIDDTKFFDIFHFDKETQLFSHPQTPLVFNYELENGNSAKFFAIYSQNKQLHLCNRRNVSVIRKSELHRNISALKLLASTKYCRYKDSMPYILIFSLENDLYMQFPDDDFFRRHNTTENYVFRLKKTTKTSFNYVLSNIETLKNVQIYGTYECEQAYLGKMGAADLRALETVENIGAAVIHTNVAPKDKQKTSYSPMEYACYKSKDLSLREYKKTTNSTKRQ